MLLSKYMLSVNLRLLDMTLNYAICSSVVSLQLSLLLNFVELKKQISPHMIDLQRTKAPTLYLGYSCITIVPIARTVKINVE